MPLAIFPLENAGCSSLQQLISWYSIKGVVTNRSFENSAGTFSDKAADNYSWEFLEHASLSHHHRILAIN